MKQISILGAGPAGSAAAIAALSESVPVRILEKSRTRRHKVCGEFLSPEVCEVLGDLGVWAEFSGMQPARIRGCILHFGRSTKAWTFSECGFGLSRYELDGLLLRRAEALGAVLSRGVRAAAPGAGCPPEYAAAGVPLILANGRGAVAPPGDRLFGFKAHFEGPADDRVALFFFPGGYAGVSSVEQGITNVCGIARESALRASGFRLDEFVRRSRPLAERIGPLSRKFGWLSVGPLMFSSRLAGSSHGSIYPAGDALGFVDPFTGSGILNALLTGRISGYSAARQIPSHRYLERCRGLLEKPYRTSALIRALLDLDCAAHLASLVPGQWLFRATRADRSGGPNSRLLAKKL